MVLAILAEQFMSSLVNYLLPELDVPDTSPLANLAYIFTA